MVGTIFEGGNVDLNKLANMVRDFLRRDGFAETRIKKDDYGHYYDVQGVKSGWWRTLSSSRKAIHVIIEGSPNTTLVISCFLVNSLSPLLTE